MTDDGRPPYRRIADDIRARVASGDLRPGDRVPPTRRLTREWGVAIATATKALAALRHEGLVEPVPGVGMIVRTHPAATRPASPAGDPGPGTPRHRGAGAPEADVRPGRRGGAAEVGARPGGEDAVAGVWPGEGSGAADGVRPGRGARAEAGVRPGGDRRAAGGRPGRVRRRDDPGLSRARVVRAGVALADAHGLEAVAMRRVAADLGVGVMSLYRHVQDRDELVRGMAAEVFGERELPEPPPPGWRACLELVARVQWDLYTRHTWLAAITSFTRPLLVPAMMAHTAWTVRALRGLGLGRADITREVITLPAFVRGVAMAHAEELAAARASGQTLDVWWNAHGAAFTEVVAGDGLADLALLRQDASEDFTALFEYGLARHLDGLSTLVRGTPDRR